MTIKTTLLSDYLPLNILIKIIPFASELGGIGEKRFPQLHKAELLKLEDNVFYIGAHRVSGTVKSFTQKEFLSQKGNSKPANPTPLFSGPVTVGVVMTITMANPGGIGHVSVRVTMGVHMTIHMTIRVGINVNILMILVTGISVGSGISLAWQANRQDCGNRPLEQATARKRRFAIRLVRFFSGF